MKTCRVCSRLLSLDNFHKQKGSADGSRNICKSYANLERTRFRQQLTPEIKKAQSKIAYAKYKKRHPDHVSKRYATPIGRWNKYKASAKHRGLEFTLDFKLFEKLITSTCIYCNENIKGYVGLDRIDNEYGYISGNVAPCCKTCNLMKSVQTVNAFRSHVHKVEQRFSNGETEAGLKSLRFSSD